MKIRKHIIYQYRHKYLEKIKRISLTNSKTSYKRKSIYSFHRALNIRSRYISYLYNLTKTDRQKIPRTLRCMSRRRNITVKCKQIDKLIMRCRQNDITETNKTITQNIRKLL